MDCISIRYRSESVLNWVEEENASIEHQNDKRLNGVIAAIKWVSFNIGVPAMKAVINERKNLLENVERKLAVRRRW